MTPPPRDPSRTVRVGSNPVGTRPRPGARPAPRRPVRRATSHGGGGLRQRPPVRRTLRRGRPDRRLRLGLVFGLVVMVVITGRLIQLQGFQGASYREDAADGRSTSTVLPAMRGPITDRNGQQLALTVEARQVFADPSLLAKDKNHTPAQVAALLAPMLNVPEADLLDAFRKTTVNGKTNKYQLLARGLTPEAGDAVTKALVDAKIFSVGVAKDTKRVYPADDLAANILGFVGTDDKGRADRKGLGGFESALNDLLAGKDGEQIGEIAGKGGTFIPVADRVLKPALPGTGIQLTIDRDIQWHAQRELAAQVKATGARGGTVTVMDVATGEILALAVAPTFNANEPGKSPPAALGNPALSNVYEPGSVNKVITLAGAIEAGLVRPTTVMSVPDRIKVKGQQYADSHDHPVERLTVAGILAKSSNVGTIKIAQKLGAERLHANMRAFGFGAKTGLGFPGESAGRLDAVKDWTNSSLPTIAFGQGMSANALQVASVYATIANDGVRVTPTLVRSHIAPDGRVTPAKQPERHKVVSEETAAQVRRMLESVTSNEGTAPAARIAGYRVAGKTGTAERPDGRGGYHGYVSSFVGFAPADNPSLLVSVVLDDPKTSYFGGVVAAPVFRDVMQFALQTRRVPPTGTIPQPYPLVGKSRG